MKWNRQTALSVKKQRNPPSIYTSPAGYVLTFGNTSCPGSEIMMFMLRQLMSQMWYFGKFDIVEDYILINHSLFDHISFDYCDIAWSNLLQQDIDRLQRLQNRSARIITRCSRSSEAIEQLHWPTLSSRRSYHKAKLVFLCLHSLVPSYFSLYFTRFSNIHNYSTRWNMRLSLPNVKQNFGKRTFLFTGANIFDKLPLNIVKSENIQTFCRRSKTFLFVITLIFYYYFKLQMWFCIVFSGFLM